jgi:hypothetical protein
MKTVLLLIGAFLSPIVPAYSQQPNPQPTVGATPMPQVTPLIPRPARGAQPLNMPVTSTVGVETEPQGLALRLLIIQRYAQPLYRKPTEEELAAIAPPLSILNKYSSVLEMPKTKVVRLVREAGCGENTKVVNVSDECLRYTMPGGGSSYSFRAGTYRLRHLADVTYEKNEFLVTGILMHGIIVKLGDLPVENISLQTPGLKYLIDFQPVKDFGKGREIERLLATGVERDGFWYRRALPALDDTTYAMRAVAYHGKVPRAVHGASYNELDFDKRRDMIVAFRVVNRGPDGSLTIIWRELSNVESPKLKTTAQTSPSEKRQN